MKKLGFIIALSALISLPLKAQEAKLDTKTSKLEWVGEKVTGKHWGTVDIKKGTLKIEDGRVAGGEIHIDMKTITVNDLTGDNKAKLEGHLKSDDFFSADKHPTGKFVIKKVKAEKLKNGNTHTVTGELTIKGKTEKISFPARITVEGNTVKAYASFELDRTRWGVRYGSGSFFDDLGDKTIYDNFQVKFNVTAEM